MDQRDCPIIEDWQSMKQEFRIAVDNVERVRISVTETNGRVLEILEHVKHLEKLDAIADILGKVARNLLYAVIGAMVMFGSLLTVYVVRDSAANFHATGPGGTSVHVEGGHPK
jgi:hypothetical protein